MEPLTPKEMGARGGKKRWEGIDPETRRAMMSEIAKRPRKKSTDNTGSE